MALSVAPRVVPPVLLQPKPVQSRGRLASVPCLGGFGAACVASAASAARSSHRRRATVLRSRLEKRVLQESPFPDEKPYEGDLVRIHYVGRLSDGTCFDNSRHRGEPFEFILGESEVIDAWEILISTMALKEKAEFICPPQYAYGADGVPPYVPPEETVTFTVDLLDIGRPQSVEEPVVDVAEEDDEDMNFWDKDGHVTGIGQTIGLKTCNAISS